MKTIFSFIGIILIWGIMAATNSPEQKPIRTVPPENPRLEHQDKIMYAADMWAQPAAGDLQSAFEQYIKYNPPPVPIKGAVSRCEFTQITLLKYQCVLTTYTITGIDSAQRVTPTWPDGYFDNTTYLANYNVGDSLLISTGNFNDSTLVAAVCNESSGAGTDSVLLERVGAFSSQDKAVIMDTLATAKTSLVQKRLPPNGTSNRVNGFTFPYWGFLGIGVACTDVNATIYILNIRKR